MACISIPSLKSFSCVKRAFKIYQLNECILWIFRLVGYLLAMKLLTFMKYFLLTATSQIPCNYCLMIVGPSNHQVKRKFVSKKKKTGLDTPCVSGSNVNGEGRHRERFTLFPTLSRLPSFLPSNWSGDALKDNKCDFMIFQIAKLAQLVVFEKSSQEQVLRNYTYQWTIYDN